jgi:hypothetical protein
MNVAVYDEAYECKIACIPLVKVVPDRIEEAQMFIKEFGRFWFKRDGKRMYLTYVPG